MIADTIGARALQVVEGGQSGAGVLRTVASDLYLKHGAGPAAELVAAEIARLRWSQDRVPVPCVTASSQDASGAWLLTGALAGTTAGSYLSRDRTRAAAIGASLGRFLCALHATPIDECPFDSSVAAWLPVVRRLVAEQRVDVDDFDPEHAEWSAEEVLAKVEALAHYAAGRVLVHGDYSLGNVVVDGRGEVVACLDVGRLGIGDPYRDVVIGWRDLGGFGAEAQQAFLAACGIDDLDAPRRELHLALDELF